jgi:hypothetical protein
MVGKKRFSRWLAGMAVLAVAECAGFAAVNVAFTTQAEAQIAEGRYPFLGRQRQQRGGGFFQQLFGPRNGPQGDSEPQQQVDYSRAPAPRKPDLKAEPVPTTTSIVVMGDGMADWLAYGLEDAFADAPEIAIVRKSKTHSGLLRYEAKSDLDWWHVARDILGTEKPNYVVMMLGVSDRQNIREKDLAKENDDKAAKNPANEGQPKKEGESDAPQAIIAPEPQPAKKSNGIIEFRSDQWEKVYSRRIDETVAALKSKGVPVFWVGLPSIRGTRSTADAVYLNDLYRARAEKAGAIYVDVWDGFVDEAGKFTSYGPDYEGQMRRLRAGDGVYFTKYGARKLAHYVEREIRRYMNNRGPIALPSGPMGPVPADGKSAARPLAGPVVPLTALSGNSDELLGGSGVPAARADAIATGVLVKGDAVAAPAGRADDFIWPRGSERPPAAVSATVPAAAAAASASAALPANVTAKPNSPAAMPVVAKPADAEPAAAKPASKPAPAVAKTEPAAPIEIKPPVPVSALPAKPAHQTVTRPRPAPPVEPRRAVEVRPHPQPTAPRPSQSWRRPSDDGLFGRNGPFGWIR